MEITNEFQLEINHELQFQAEDQIEPAELKLIEGRAEIYGVEAVINKSYFFPAGFSVAVFSWHGCKLYLTGHRKDTFIASKTPMILYLNAHAYLENMRQISEKDLPSEKVPKGPVSMVVGSAGVGKSTVCQILINYAVRKQRNPIYVDLDVGQGNISVPGTIGAVPIKESVLLEDGYPCDDEVVYHHGHNSPPKNILLYKSLISKLANSVRNKMASDKKIGASGAIINTCGWITHGGYGCLTYIAKKFEVDVIFVLDDTELYHAFSNDIPFVEVIYLPKSGGVLPRSKKARAGVRNNRIKNYFFGRKKCESYVFEVNWNELPVFKVDTDNLPISYKSGHMTKLIRINPVRTPKHTVLAISSATDAEKLNWTTEVKGFLVVVDVNEETQTWTILSKEPKPLQKCLLIQSEILYVDSN